MEKVVQQSRNENLQILRFVAAAFVLLTHITLYIHERVDAMVNVWHIGEVGVPIFFAISGFVMHFSGMRLSKDSAGARTFLRRRVARIFPLYWLISTVKLGLALAVPATVLHNHPDFLHTLASYALFPMFNDEGQVRPLHGVAWTLLHEMLFYYVFSLGMALRQSPFLFSTLVIGALWGAGFFIEPTMAWQVVCFDGLNLMFVAGMVLSAVYQNGFHLPKWVALVLLAASMAGIFGLDVGPLRFSVLQQYNAAAALVVMAALSLSASALLGFKRVLVELGDSSYSMYLIHPLLAPAVCIVMLKLNVTSAFAVLPAAFVVCVAASLLVYKYIESPLNGKAKKWLEKII